MQLTFGTGFRCPTCRKEAEYSTGFWSAFTKGLFINAAMQQLDRQGGKMTCARCGYTWRITPGSRLPGAKNG